jgi:ubiquinone/menaquinone biosynthesis C-methylase UbiE
VEWSHAITKDDYDVKAVVRLLRSAGNESIRGLDVGGGIGKFASVITENVERCSIVVVDNSDLVKDSFVVNDNVTLVESDWFEYKPESKFDFVIFKTVLHHFVESSELKTRNAQVLGLLKAAEVLKNDGILIVEENFYESAFGLGDLTGRLIYEITKLTVLEKITRKLGANTAGEGVRFRSMSAWEKIFQESGFKIDQVTKCQWDWQTWQKIPLMGKDRFQALLSLSKIESS